MKRVFVLVLALILLVSSLPIYSVAAEEPATDTQPKIYRWKMSDNQLVSDPDSGVTQNDLTLLSGSVKNDVLSGVRYSLETPIVLHHDRTWSIEWSCKGNWSGMLVASTLQSPSIGFNYLFRDPSTKIFAFGEYDGVWNNYGMALKYDTAVLHTFRVENRIAEDGTNTVYLMLDGQEIGPMTRHFISAKDQNKDVNWANGKDVVIANIGTSSHPMNGMELDYLQIVEDKKCHVYTPRVTFSTDTQPGYTDYTCALCGDFYRTPWLDESAYKGMTIACVGDSITAAYGVTKDKTDYVTLLAQKLGMNYIRLGVSGTTLCTDGSRTCNIGQMTVERLKGADIVTIAMGINDFCGAGAGYYELGDIHTTDSSTIYGAMKMWCERIGQLRQDPSLKDTRFYFVTPQITSWNNSVTSARNWDQTKVNIHGYTLRDLCNAIIEVAELYGIGVIDLNILSGLYYVDAQDNNIAVFGGDGVHPGDQGHQMMATALANVLLQNDLRDDHPHTYGSWITTTWPSPNIGEQKCVCSICSATESRILNLSDPGDINGDGKIDHHDAIYLLLHTMFGQERYPLNAAPADMDGNGTVDQEDAVYLLLHSLFGKEFYPI